MDTQRASITPRCEVRSSITDVQCELDEGHEPYDYRRFHKFSPPRNTSGLTGLIEAIRSGKGYWYIEARVGRDNFRGDEVRFIHDRRGEHLPADRSEYVNDVAVEMVQKIVRHLTDELQLVYANVSRAEALIGRPHEHKWRPDLVLCGAEQDAVGILRNILDPTHTGRPTVVDNDFAAWRDTGGEG